ncbi:E3 ubiquitin-protein ligase JMJ24 [Linum perenne]
MDNPRSSSANVEDNVDMPDDLRCKRSDGKQWRCTAMSMPDKTVCEKHYIQAKRRAANSALRASLKKAKKKSAAAETSDGYLESKSGDEFDMPLSSIKAEDHSLSGSSKKKGPAGMRSFSEGQHSDEFERDVEDEENWRSYNNTPPLSTGDSPRSRSQRSFDAMPVMDYSVGTTGSYEDTGGQTCHQCQRKDRSRVLWCLKCDKRGFCDNCITAWYPDILWEEIEKVCPACRGICNCKACLRGDNMVKVRIREIPVIDKLQYLYCLLSSVLPVVKQIHDEQCSEVELEKRLRGTDNIDLARVKLNADEQMCCNICRIPIIDYHRHCPSCSFDLCLHCCQDLRDASDCDFKCEVRGWDKDPAAKQVKDSRLRLDMSDDYPHWKANSDASIPCPPRDYGGCNYSSMGLSRIFKMNWVAKLVKNVEEMVSGCKVNEASSSEELWTDDPTLSQCAYRDDSEDNFLYSPSSGDIKARGVNVFRKHWSRGEPVIVKQVFDWASMPSWDPMVIWRGILETSDGKMKEENRTVKAIDCLSWSEVVNSLSQSFFSKVDLELGQFIKGYKEGRTREDGSLEMLKLKDWPSPSASEEFLLYQRPEFLSKLPLLEYIHSRLGLLNVAAKLPHYSLQNDVGPKIYLSYGTVEELGRGDSVANLHFKMRDMVYLLVHTHEVKPQGWVESESSDSETSTNERLLPDLSRDRADMLNVGTTTADDNEIMGEQKVGTSTDIDGDERMEERVVEEGTTDADKVERRKHRQSKKETGGISAEARSGVQWDVFRRQDVPRIVEYLRNHIDEFRDPGNADLATSHLLYDGTIFLNGHHKQKLKEESGVEPWSFDQHLGEAIFIPAGCPFQVRNLQSTVQLALDFLSPESVGEAARLGDEIRCLPNDHEAKLQVMEVGKISLYAASSSIKEVQKLVLDPKFSAEIGFEDPNLTATISENLEKLTGPRQISCA